MPEELLVLERVSKHFLVGGGLSRKGVRRVAAVRDVDLRLMKGEIFGLVGESGSGKSTIARMIMRIYTPASGRLLYRGNDITALRGQALRTFQREVQMVFQDPGSSLNPRRTVGQTLTLPLATHRVVPRRQWPARVAELLEMVELPARFAEKYPHELSGGQKQRVAIARALAPQPKLLLLDEPTSALDVSVQAKVVALLERLHRQLGLTYLFISHDLSLVRNVATRLAVLYRGEVVEVGSTPEVFAHPLHPYTRRLLSAIPVVSAEEEQLKPRWDLDLEVQRLASGFPDPEGGSQGRPGPSMVDADSVNTEAARLGCPFYLRCPVAVERCLHSHPPLMELRDSQHAVRCHVAHAELQDRLNPSEEMAGPDASGERDEPERRGSSSSRPSGGGAETA